MTESRRPEAGEDAGGWRGRSRPGRATTPGSEPTEWEYHKGHIKKEPLQPDSQSASQLLQTKHTGLTKLSDFSYQLATFQATAFSAL
ncbi:unnamed protein product [Schistocephalus solidus]|uniref:Myelin basic protein n=1 Tax=Schistocephalus solidus TaxID=70667 RepID=A0A183SVK2_SCHSO|nr:unnamed protein product [Schistocephalus solidus]